jgi:hypothetical protein
MNEIEARRNLVTAFHSLAELSRYTKLTSEFPKLYTLICSELLPRPVCFRFSINFFSIRNVCLILTDFCSGLTQLTLMPLR